jgi:hypothetical protein
MNIAPWLRKWFRSLPTSAWKMLRRPRTIRLQMEHLETRFAPSITTLATFSGANCANPEGGRVLFGTS